MTVFDLYEVGRVLGVAMAGGETHEQFRARLREQWRLILRVVG